MKVASLTALFCLMTFSALPARGDVIDPYDYTSLHNFTMPAIEIDPDQGRGEVNVILKEALLAYPDHGMQLNRLDQLSQVFDLNRLNAVILTYSDDDCAGKNLSEGPGQLVSCSVVDGSVKVQGAVTGFDGEILEKSHETWDQGWLHVNIRQVTTKGVRDERTYLKASVGGNLKRPTRNGEFEAISLYVNKSFIAARPVPERRQ